MLTRKISELNLHPVNERVYGTTKYEYLSESVAAKGVIEPLLVTHDNRIINGGRRWVVAKLSGLEEVPVIVFPSDDDLDIKEAVVHTNKQREKDPFVRCEEAAVLWEVEDERARRRQAAAAATTNAKLGRGEETLVARLPQASGDDKGKTRDKIGEALGVGGRTAGKMVTVGKAIRKAEETGDIETVEKLKETVNSRGVDPAYREAKKTEGAATTQPRTITDPKPIDVLAAADLWLRQSRLKFRKMTKVPGGKKQLKEWCARNGLPFEVLVGLKAAAPA